MILTFEVKGNDVIAGPFPENGVPEETFFTRVIEQWKSPDRTTARFVWELSDFNRSGAPYWISMDLAGSVATEMDMFLNFTVSPVPIPAAGALLASALGLAGVFRRRRAT